MKKLIVTISLLTVVNVFLAQNENKVKTIANEAIQTDVTLLAQGINQTTTDASYQRWVVRTDVKNVELKQKQELPIVEKQNKETTLEIFPNPVNDGVLNVRHKFNETGKIALYDITGKLIQQISVNQFDIHYTLNVTELKAGAYICLIQEGDFVHNQKVIVQ